MLSTLSQILLYLHIIAGTISLVLFWIPVLSKKGKQIHNQAGRWYVRAMTVTVASAFVLCLLRMYYGSWTEGLALLFLSVLTAIPLTSGVQVLKAKKPTPRYNLIRVYLAGTLLATSLALTIAWWLLGSGLLLAFAIIGLLAGLADLKQYLPIHKSPKNSCLREHYSGMLFSGAAAYTAFFAFGGRTLLGNILTGWWTLLPWLLPTFLTMALMPFIHRKYKQNRKPLKTTF